MVVYFGRLAFETRDTVYAPREDSYLLARNQSVKPGSRVLDVGTGCGMQALVAAGTGGEVVGVDVNPDAVELSRYNANLNRIVNCEFFLSDLFENVEGRFDHILFNPPYLDVREEGKIGLSYSGGSSGVAVIRRFMEDAAGFLEGDGAVQILASSINNQENLERLFERNGFSHSLSETHNLFFEQLYLYELKLG